MSDVPVLMARRNHVEHHSEYVNHEPKHVHEVYDDHVSDKFLQLLMYVIVWITIVMA
mgnify:CR=1 FL=1